MSFFKLLLLALALDALDAMGLLPPEVRHLVVLWFDTVVWR